MDKAGIEIAFFSFIRYSLDARSLSVSGSSDIKVPSLAIWNALGKKVAHGNIKVVVIRGWEILVPFEEFSYNILIKERYCAFLSRHIRVVEGTITLFPLSPSKVVDSL